MDQIKQIEQQVKEYIIESKNRLKSLNDTEDISFTKGFIKGLNKVLHLIDSPLASPMVEATPINESDPSPQLSKLDPQTAMGLLLKNPRILDDHSTEDLCEAAFHFENQYMSLLGDPNTIDFQTYTALSRDKLISIISASLEDISKLKADV